jgi:DNA-3-methyladenine glycosylase I
MNKKSVNRCSWADNNNNYPEMQLYHDKEWGVPVHEDTKLFEFLVLECAQAGLSWSTILKKRQDYRRAFGNFNVKQVANIVRNKLKISSAVTNAKAFIRVQHEFGSFDKYIWRFVEGGGTKHNFFRNCKQVPIRSVESDNLSKDLKVRGFSFVGPTICYAMMQAIGMINDHIIYCFRHKELLGMKDR